MPISNMLMGQQIAKTSSTFTLRPLYLYSASRPLSDDGNDSSNSSDIMRRLAVRGGGGDDTSSTLDRTKAFVSKNFFLLGMVVAVSFAKFFPQVGMDIF